MAGLTKAERKRLKELRQDFETLPGYADILRKAAVNDWDTFELLNAITNSQTFRRQFPGLMQGGQLADFLTGQANAPLSAQSLGRAVQNYRAFEKSYQDTLDDFPGAINGKLTRDRLASLIRSETSPDEFRTRIAAINKVKANPDLFDAWQKAARAAGLGKLDPFKAAGKVADQKFYDVYEAARIEQMGLGLSLQENRQVAKSLTNVDERGNIAPTSDAAIAELVATVKAQQSDIGPELANEGISALDLSKWVASGGTSDPQLSLRLQQLVATKRGRGAYVAGKQTRGGPGGAAQYDEQGAASYG